MNLWTYRRRFAIDGLNCEVVMRSSMQTLASELLVAGETVDADSTPAGGAEALRNHGLDAMLPDGRRLHVDAGYVSWWTVGVAVRVDGVLVHESHPGRVIAFPSALRGMVGQAADPKEHWRKNAPALLTDLALGLLFFVVAKTFDLTTAALVSGAAGLVLLVVQRFVRVDLLGGLALFGVAVSLLSAAYALAVQDEELVKLRTTVIGVAVALMFVADGLAGGRWLGRGLARYLPYEGLRIGRLSLGMGLNGALLAGINLIVAKALPTDVWLFYTTFGDVTLGALLFFAVLRFARPEHGSAHTAAVAP